ncbi:hypothetical protein [Flavobacterium sp.]|uniref:hypothetical protein n=1 Tax=Flavobacterium sp. TaxID=239 RepID=UPI00374DE501
MNTLYLVNFDEGEITQETPQLMSPIYAEYWDVISLELCCQVSEAEANWDAPSTSLRVTIVVCVLCQSFQL